MDRRKRIYRTPSGKVPFLEWVADLRDARGLAAIGVRIERALQGNLGDHRSVGTGVIELRIGLGPGYRVYIGLQGQEIIILLCGGDKSTQQSDIAKAHRYWANYKESA